MLKIMAIYKQTNFVSRKIFSEKFVAIHEFKPALTPDKPIYAGFSLLDLNKYFMYDIHYEHAKTHDAKLPFTVTDSLVYEIKTDDSYEDFYKDKHLFHLINYPKDSKLFDPELLVK